MLYIPNDDMFVNKFVDVNLPTKAQIFGRTGQHAVQPAGAYTGDDIAHFADTPTSGLARMCADAEAYEISTDEVKETKSEKK